MALKDFKEEIENEAESINSRDFTHEITNTKHVPDINDPAITYPNLTALVQKSKRLQSAVMFVDMRGSTAMSMNNQNMTELAPLYSSFIRAMSKSAHYFNGKVRNIIGDRVMVVFDRDNCYRDAVNTAILMNSVVRYVLDVKIKGFTVKAGIGIDFGEMLVCKSGVVKQGDENDPNKALVWLGKPANVASKLTDMANKVTKGPFRTVSEMHLIGGDGTQPHDYDWFERTVDQFLDSLPTKSLNTMTHKNITFRNFMKSTKSYDANPPILMTKYFYEGLVKEDPENGGVKNALWKEQDLSIPGYPNRIMGGDVIFTEFQN